MSKWIKKRFEIIGISLYTKQRKIYSFLTKRRNGGLNKKRDEDFLTTLATTIKKDPHNFHKKAR